MTRLNVLPEFLGLETEEGGIFRQVEQLLNYIYEAPTLDRHQLATAVVEVTGKCWETLSNEKVKVSSLKERVHILDEELQNVQERREGAEASDCPTTEKNAEATEDLADQLPKETNSTIHSSNSEYEIEAILGGGSFGVVVQCWKKPSNKSVAIKVIKDTSSIKSAMEELNVLESLKASAATKFNIVSCNENFIYDGHLCLEFEKLDISLLDYIRSKGVLPLQEIRPFIQQVAVALCHLVDAGVLHGDLKPENIMLVDRCRQPLKLQVIDFGLAQCNPELYTGQLLQTLWYRAPEVLLRAPFSHAIDVWSLGCIAAEMLQGTPLFHCHDENEMMQRIISAVGLPPDDVLQLGLNTGCFFQERSPSQQSQGWTFKAPAGGTPQMSSAQGTQGPHTSLADLLKAPAVNSTEDDQAVECDWKCFIDLVGKMLHPNHLERIKPAEILSHPFITLSHLNQQSSNSYLESSIKCMEACSFWSFHGGENVEQPSSSTTSADNNDNLTGEHPPSELSSETQPSAQDVFSRGAKRLSRKRPLECVSRSLEKSEDELECTTSDFASPQRKRIRLNSPTSKHVEKNTPPNESILRGRKRKHEG